MATVRVVQNRSVTAAPIHGASTVAQSAPLRAEAERVVRGAAGGILAGLVGGFLVGGLGGRLAMRLVAVQTDDRFRGLTTDDGATTGEISLDGTLLLISFVTLLGVIGGLVHVAVRPVLPDATWPRRLSWGLVTGVLGGAAVVHDDGVDFTVLGSPATSVAVFVGLLALYGVVTASVADRLLAPEGWCRRARLLHVAPVFVLLLPAGTIVPVAVLGAAVIAVRALGWHRHLPRSAVRVVGQLGLVLLVGAVAISLSRTIVEVV